MSANYQKLQSYLNNANARQAAQAQQGQTTPPSGGASGGNASLAQQRLQVQQQRLQLAQAKFSTQQQRQQGGQGPMPASGQKNSGQGTRPQARKKARPGWLTPFTNGVHTLASVPTPGDLMAPILILLVFVWAIVPVNGNYTRLYLLWLVLTGQAALPADGGAGGAGGAGGNPWIDAGVGVGIGVKNLFQNAQQQSAQFLAQSQANSAGSSGSGAGPATPRIAEWENPIIEARAGYWWN